MRIVTKQILLSALFLSITLIANSQTSSFDLFRSAITDLYQESQNKLVVEEEPEFMDMSLDEEYPEVEEEPEFMDMSLDEEPVEVEVEPEFMDMSVDEDEVVVESPPQKAVFPTSEKIQIEESPMVEEIKPQPNEAYAITQMENPGEADVITSLYNSTSDKKDFAALMSKIPFLESTIDKAFNNASYLAKDSKVGFMKTAITEYIKAILKK